MQDFALGIEMEILFAPFAKRLEWIARSNAQMLILWSTCVGSYSQKVDSYLGHAVLLLKQAFKFSKIKLKIIAQLKPKSRNIKFLLLWYGN